MFILLLGESTVTPEFWQNAWDSGKTGWRQSRVNTRLVSYWPQLQSKNLPPENVPSNPESVTVFVPLCGDSPDMKWLLEQGYGVVGCELSESACERFFNDHGLTFTRSSEASFSVFRGDSIVIYCGDYFALTSAHLDGVSMVYDRAATVALPADIRARYAEHMGAITSTGTDMLLITFEYDQSKMDGPPFSVADAEVQRLYGKQFQIERLGGSSGPEILGNLKERGLDTVAETIFHLRHE